MRERIARDRDQADDPRQDYMIGCLGILMQPFLLLDSQRIPNTQVVVPAYSTRAHLRYGRGDGRRLWELIMDRIAAHAGAPIAVPRYGEPVLIRPRLGQGAFRIGVTGVYQRRCAVTGASILPILDAAHIRPDGAGGGHEVTNGLLLRTDVHRLFDLGYVTVSGDGRFEVGRRLKDDFENGRLYYEMRSHCPATSIRGPRVMRLSDTRQTSSSADQGWRTPSYRQQPAQLISPTVELFVQWLATLPLRDRGPRARSPT